MGRWGPESVSEHLWRLHQLAQDAARARRRIVEAMIWARRDGVTDEQIADVTGLSVEAIRHYIAADEHQRQQRGSGSDTVGRTPPRPRHRTDRPRG